MGFGKKKGTDSAFASFTQQNVSELASQALQKSLSTRVHLPIRFTMQTPLLVQRWTSKAVRKMLGNMVGMPEPREAKDLTADFEQSWYRNTEGAPAMPCRIIKAALVEGAISTGKTVSKAELNRGLRVLGYCAPLILPKGYKGPEGHKESVPRGQQPPGMHTAIVRNAGGQPDVRARAQFPVGTTFEAVLSFSLPLTPDKVMAAAIAAGETIGLCEWRPAKGGDLGTFSIDVLPSDEKTISRVLKATSVMEDEFILPPEMLRAFRAVPAERLNDSQRKVKALVDHREGQGGAGDPPYEEAAEPPPRAPLGRGGRRAPNGHAEA